MAGVGLWALTQKEQRVMGGDSTPLHQPWGRGGPFEG